MAKKTTADPVVQLQEWFQRNGYVRRLKPDRLKEGRDYYKKGFEVRLVAKNKTELREMQRALKVVGFRPGKPFLKGKQYCLPIYGRDAVKEFLFLLGVDESKAKPKKGKR